MSLKEPLSCGGVGKDRLGGVKTFAIITTDANELVGEVHNRMPAILRRESERHWLEWDITQERLSSFLYPYPANLMTMYEVSRQVNRATEDGPEIIKPLHKL